jgi:hypothetical protein
MNDSFGNRRFGEDQKKQFIVERAGIETIQRFS